MKNNENVGLNYEQEYHRLNDEIFKKLEEQKEHFEKEKSKLEEELRFYKEIIKREMEKK